VLLASGIDGLICTNTTIDREVLHGHPLAAEAGGLSGAPVMARPPRARTRCTSAWAARVPIIGVGGILGGADAVAKFEAGAHTGAVLQRHGLSRSGADRRMRGGPARASDES
jgi:dihydroorotate dehydrogenase